MNALERRIARAETRVPPDDQGNLRVLFQPDDDAHESDWAKFEAERNKPGKKWIVSFVSQQHECT